MGALSAPSGAIESTDWLKPVNSRQTLPTRLARMSGDDIGQAVGCDRTTASRIASDQRGATLSEWCALIEAAGLKLVSREKLCVSKDEFNFMRQTTARAMQHAQIARMLFEDPE